MTLDQMGDPLSSGTSACGTQWLSQALEVKKEAQGTARSPLPSISEGLPMIPEPGFVEFVIFLCYLHLSLFLSHHHEEFVLLFLQFFLIKDPFPEVSLRRKHAPSLQLLARGSRPCEVHRF